jgi:hypothetical protein
MVFNSLAHWAEGTIMNGLGALILRSVALLAIVNISLLLVVLQRRKFQRNQQSRNLAVVSLGLRHFEKLTSLKYDAITAEAISAAGYEYLWSPEEYQVLMHMKRNLKDIGHVVHSFDTIDETVVSSGGCPPFMMQIPVRRRHEVYGISRKDLHRYHDRLLNQ